MAEPGSSNEPPKKRPRNEPRKVRILFKAPGRNSYEIWVPDYWLSSSEFFEAKLARWTTGDDSKIEPIVLELSGDCRPERGAKIFKKRLLAAEIEEEGDWDTVKWWKSVSGDEESLFSALCIFDLVIMEHYCKEVAETLKVFEVECGVQVGSIAKKYNAEVICLEQQPFFENASCPIKAVSPDDFDAMAVSLIEYEDVTIMPLMERAIPGCLDSDKLEYCRTLSNCYHRLVEKRNLTQWSYRQMRYFFAKDPALFKGVLDHLLETVENPPDQEVQAVVATLCAQVLHDIFKESGRDKLDESSHRDVVACVDYTFKQLRTRKGFKKTSDEFKSSISLPIFAVASTSVQRSLMLALGDDMYDFLRNNVHLVHPDLRRMLLSSVYVLSDADRKCLVATSVFKQVS
mmetsp:Transcript_82545/g.181430  ORF Transcript_82545/g.181430 Transcript_82545/m.181430 type:complete len:402 (+) Transcript_82545:111-1316(+)